MSKIDSASSLFAPALASAHGKVVASWTYYVDPSLNDPKQNQVCISVYDIATMQWLGMPLILNGVLSETRPALTFWNGVYYQVTKGLLGDNNFYLETTDLVTFMPDPIKLGNYNNTGSWIPALFPYGDNLILVANNTVGTLNYAVASANWLLTGNTSPWSGPQAVTLPNSISVGAAIAVASSETGYLWCVAYGTGNVQEGSSQLWFATCSNPTWATLEQTTQIPGAIPMSYPVITVYDGAFYLAWQDKTLGGVYACGTIAANQITWSSAQVIPGIPAGNTDVSITSGPDGIFVGFCVPATSTVPSLIGFVRLSPA